MPKTIFLTKLTHARLIFLVKARMFEKSIDDILTHEIVTSI